MAKRNKYEKRAHKKQLLGGIAVRKGDLKQVGMDTARDVLIGAIGGGLAGALLGRSSFLVGIAVTGAGHYLKKNAAAAFGIGMMASGGYQTIAGVSGIEKEGFEGVKDRFNAFKEEFKRKLFLDKIIKSKKDSSVEGMGDVQYFTYPNRELVGANESTLDLGALDRIEREVEESARAFEGSESDLFSGVLPDEMGILDVGDQNF